MGGRVDAFSFAPVDDYLHGNGVVHEPHSFDVTVSAAHAASTHEWTYASYEGRTTIERGAGGSRGR